MKTQFSHNIKRNDTVILKDHPDPLDVNHRAVVRDVTEKTVLISNSNMPFMGTYSLTWLPISEVRKD